MAGGIIQLVAKGVQDIFITDKPQITFFKIIYRRHTNFSIEHIQLDFNNKPNFGKKVSCTITKAGDLVHKIFLMVKLPRIPKFFDENGKEDKFKRIAWVNRVGFALIKNVEIEIGGQLIDRHYGEWLNIWNELTGTKNRGYNIIIGESKEVTDFSNGKDEISLFIPLEFWFCKSIGSALPLVCLEYSKVNINIEFNDLDRCIVMAPTNSIKIHEDIVNLKPYEYITQKVNNQVADGIFIGFDEKNKRIYYNNVSNNNFVALQDETPKTIKKINDRLKENDALKYQIIGCNSNFRVSPELNSGEKRETITKLKNNLRSAKLLVEYIYLDEEERMRFLKEKHEYLIEQLQFSSEKSVDTNIKTFRLGFLQPTKELIFVLNLNTYLKKNINDHFNYTNSFKRYEKTNKLIGKSLIEKAVLMLNGQEIFSERDNAYWNYLQPLWHHNNGPEEGINMYSFALSPEKTQPSGTLNMSTIDHILLRIVTDKIINFNNPAKLKIYTKSTNVLRIIHGLSGLVFTNQQN